MSHGQPAPLVAIATPVYNGAAFLAETMECVQAQTYPNLVHCVLDNASSDETSAIIERYRGGRVPLIAARNAETLSLGDNWNAAVRLIPREAHYFRVLPADDIIVPTCIEKMVALGERYNNVSVVGCQERINDRLLGAGLPRDRCVFDGRAIVRGLLQKKDCFTVLHCLYRIPPDGVADPFYDTECYGTRLLGNDADAAMRVLTQGACAFVHEPLVVTRTHENTVTSKEVAPNKLNLWAHLQLVDRWGPRAFDNEADFRACRNHHLRSYSRHLLFWHFSRQQLLLDQHWDWLCRASALPTPVDYVRSVAEWPILRASRLFERASLSSFASDSNIRPA